MKKILLLLLLISHPAIAQEKVVKYFTAQHKLTSADSAYYFLTFTKPDPKTLEEGSPPIYDTVRSYYAANRKLRTQYIRDQWYTYTGDFVDYYENGQIERRGTYRKSARIGNMTTFYSTGKTRSVLFYPETIADQNRQYFQLQTYNGADGFALVSGGNGYCKCVLNDDRLVEHGKVLNGYRDSVWLFYEGDTLRHTEKFDSGVFVSGVYHDRKGDFAYDQLDIEPAPKMSLSELYKSIAQTMHYPKEAFKKKLEGTVFIGFIVDREGKLIDFNIIKGVAPVLDEEALRVMKLLEPWTPGRQRGKTVRRKYVLPVKFVL
jgi:TonB family protein